ncbi:UNVERIFIED_CONTAM: 8-hydroxyquercetin 8-O-methyltransferase [Sesamum latifolium]|uniref:8-hydroxyquercetin 8-O-methyltransferase n=1 Tax=Sesamum latifolium TaxID=2727402 RepID=A0AAW2XQE6_9LAMI
MTAQRSIPLITGCHFGRRKRGTRGLVICLIKAWKEILQWWPSVITRDCRQVFEGLDSLVDVAEAPELWPRPAEAFPQIQCTVLDLAPIVAGLEGGRNLKYIEEICSSIFPHQMQFYSR